MLKLDIEEKKDTCKLDLHCELYTALYAVQVLV